MAKDKIVFLDRDGTLVWDRPGFYLRRPEQLRFYKHTFPALKLLKKAGYRMIVVTNQSGIGRGFLNEATLAKIHSKMRQSLSRHGIRITGIYYCPHAPEVPCQCRKPSAYLARKALKDLRLTLGVAAVIGDKKADVDLAHRLGIDSIHISTGHGRDQREKYGKKLNPTHTAKNLLTATRWLLKHHSNNGKTKTS